MLKDYFIVSKEILPEVFHKVVKAKELMDKGEATQISEVVKKVGLSRSAYYKYKDHIFVPSESMLDRKALISFVLSHEKGILSEVLNEISKFNCSILTINQNIPIQNNASVLVSIDLKDMAVDMKELIEKLETLTGVSKVTLVSIE